MQCGPYALSNGTVAEKLRKTKAKLEQQFSSAEEAMTLLTNKNKLKTNQKQREIIGYTITP